MRRGTTPTLLITIPDRDLRDATIFVSIRQTANTPPVLTKTNDSLDVSYENGDSVLAVRYSQEDTLSLISGNAEIQVRWIFENELADGSAIATIVVDPILKEGVIEYAG